MPHLVLNLLQANPALCNYPGVEGVKSAWARSSSENLLAQLDNVGT